MAIIQEKKIKYIWPGEQKPQDSSIPYVMIGELLLTSAMLFILSINILFVVTWHFIQPTGLSLKDTLTGTWGVIFFGITKLSWLRTKNVNHMIDYLLWMGHQGHSIAVLCRWGIDFLGALSISVISFIDGLKKPIIRNTHVRGKELLEDKKAYFHLKREFNQLIQNDLDDSGLVIQRDDMKFDPTENKYELKKDPKKRNYIVFPEDYRRTHSIIIGGTGRGKTISTNFLYTTQIYKRIRKGLKDKLIIIDTPKGDYIKQFKQKDVNMIAPHLAGGVSWDIAVDLNNDLIAEAFWKGKIPSSEADPIWPNAAIAIGTACTKFLQKTVPKKWNYGLLSYLFSKNIDFLKRVVTLYYPEGLQIVSAAEETVSSVLFNLSTYTKDITSLARIYDGYDSKIKIRQATSAALKNKQFIDIIFQDMMEDNTSNELAASRFTAAILLAAASHYLTETKPNWIWKDFAEFVKKDVNTQLSLVDKQLEKLPKIVEHGGDDFRGIIDQGIFIDGWKEICALVLAHAEEWDEMENGEKLSIREWINDENTEKRVLSINPSETYPTLTHGLVRGILLFMNAVILDMRDSKERKYHIIIDELPSFGNIGEFIKPALALYRSKGVGVILAFQDLAQLVEIYKQEFVDFLTSNVGNIFILGVNDGFTAKKISELVGERSFNKVHRSISFQKDGQSASEDIQEHKEQVITADEINMLGAKMGSVNLLYIPAKIKAAYVLKTKICNYPERTITEKARWTSEGYLSERFAEMDNYWKASPTIQHENMEQQYEEATPEELEKEFNEESYGLEDYFGDEV